jgi:hypothetical protein
MGELLTIWPASKNTSRRQVSQRAEDSKAAGIDGGLSPAGNSPEVSTTRKFTVAEKSGRVKTAKKRIPKRALCLNTR